jgi:hypothetical protein
MVELCRFVQWTNRSFPDFNQGLAVSAGSLPEFSPPIGEDKEYYMTDLVTGFAAENKQFSRPDENSGTIFRVLENSEAESRRFHPHLFFSQSALRFGTQILHLSGG